MLALVGLDGSAVRLTEGAVKSRLTLPAVLLALDMAPSKAFPARSVTDPDAMTGWRVPSVQPAVATRKLSASSWLTENTQPVAVPELATSEPVKLLAKIASEKSMS